ncbi:MAG: alpha/beta fold hydrolase [Acidimicrobiales bacterium]
MLHRETTGAGPRLVLIHGFTQTSESWGPVAADLALDHEVVRVDAPGHGRSSGVRADQWEGARLLGQAGGRATYVGYSMGGRLALHLALSQPGLVERLVLVSATAGIDDAGARAERREADDQLACELERSGVDTFLERWLRLPLFAGLDPARADLDARRRNTVPGLSSSLRLAGTGTIEPALWDRLGSMEMPVLVVAGQQDPKVPALADRLGATSGAGATLDVRAGAGHAVPLAAPEAFVAALRSFLSAKEPSR